MKKMAHTWEVKQPHIRDKENYIINEEETLSLLEMWPLNSWGCLEMVGDKEADVGVRKKSPQVQPHGEGKHHDFSRTRMTCVQVQFSL